MNSATTLMKVCSRFSGLFYEKIVIYYYYYYYLLKKNQLNKSSRDPLSDMSYAFIEYISAGICLLKRMLKKKEKKENTVYS